MTSQKLKFLLELILASLTFQGVKTLIPPANTFLLIITYSLPLIAYTQLQV